MVTVVINASNNESLIVDCIQSARLLTDQIVVIDQESQDQTAALAKEYGARVYSFPPTRYVEPARMFGVGQAASDWVFILDTDERLTSRLADEIKGFIASPRSTHYTSCTVPRKNIFGKRTWLKHGGWWPDRQIRLVKKDALKDWPARIHSTPVIEGAQTRLTSPIEHHFHTDIAGMVAKTTVFEDVESTLLYEGGRDTRVFTFFRKYFGELFRRLIKKQGFRDGVYGYIESIYQAYSKTITWLYLYEKKYITKP